MLYYTFNNNYMPSLSAELKNSHVTNVYSFDLDDTIIPTSIYVEKLTREYFGHLLDKDHKHTNNDPYQTMKDLLKAGKVTEKQFATLFHKAHVLALHHPFRHMCEFINSLAQEHVHLVTSRKTFYNPEYIIKVLNRYINKTLHMYNPESHKDNKSSTDFMVSNAAKDAILFKLHETFGVTHFVDDLPFLHPKLTNSPVALVLHMQPWTEIFCEQKGYVIPLSITA